ncbi:MAG TPA: 3-dehydroquinate synthase [Gemmataceae bacterium]|nr:3-dehydroquinate synthase [Gemmataceae bacterium]
MSNIRINLGPRSYDIAIVSNDPTGLTSFVEERCPRSRSALIISDEHVHQYMLHFAAALADAGLRVEQAVLPAGEATKCLAQASHLYDRLAEMPADRQTLIVAVGGGVIGDLAGFVAATYNRGLPLVMIPTTLLAMVDSSVGGKVGINHPKGKNLIGAFHQPAGVWIDIGTFNTLPEREYRSGLAEVVKYGVVLDAEFFAFVERNADAILKREPEAIRHVISRCCRLKADVVEKDEREETGLRAVLNYGHTFAHTFETAGGYGHWLHGEAVAAGMVCASRLTERLGLISAEITQRLIELLQKFQLPVGPEPWPAEELIAIMRRDKKAHAGLLRFVIARQLGQFELVEASAEQVTAVIASFHGQG